MARLIDLSSHNQGIDFHAVKRSGVAGVWIKATEGVSYVNPLYAEHTKAARAAGLRVGAYHFARPDNNRPLDEARFFAETVGKVGRRDLRPVLDLESGSAQPLYVSWARVFNASVREGLEAGPLFYSSPYYIAEMRPEKPIGYGLWLASYGRNDGGRYPVSVPAPWRRYAAHQFTSCAQIPGVPGMCDHTYAPLLSRVLAHPVLGLV